MAIIQGIENLRLVQDIAERWVVRADVVWRDDEHPAKTIRVIVDVAGPLTDIPALLDQAEAAADAFLRLALEVRPIRGPGEPSQ